MSITILRKTKNMATQCKVCGAPAFHKYFGIASCQPCKTFFKRNAEIGLNALNCNHGGNCEIHFINRRVCTSCRLAKCFASGMAIEMIRPPRLKKVNKPVASIKNEYNQPQIPTLNLLRFDPSELNYDQWNLISNLVHCYEEHSALSCIRNFILEQTTLPIKMRCKTAAIDKLFESILSGVELFFKSNHHYLSLCPHDRSILLRSAMENAGTFGSILVYREVQSFDQPGVPESIETVYGTTVKNLSTRLLDEVDRDITFVKLGIAMFAFSTTNCSSYTTIGFDHLTNIKDVLHIQNMYAEVTWKYLLYKYNYAQTVIFFTNLIKTHLLINVAINEARQSEHHKLIMENLIEKINQHVTINK